jgi:hypothetical protein
VAVCCEHGRAIGFHKMRGISYLARKLLTFQEGLCSR